MTKAAQSRNYGFARLFLLLETVKTAYTMIQTYSTTYTPEDLNRLAREALKSPDINYIGWSIQVNYPAPTVMIVEYDQYIGPGDAVGCWEKRNLTIAL